MSTATESYKIPEVRLGELRAKVERINKAANKLSLPPVVMTVGEFEMVEVQRTELEGEVGAPKQYKKVYDVTLTGETPMVAGWTFRASLLHMYGDEAATIVKSVIGYDKDIPVVYRNRSGICDHCGFTRYRKKTYVLEHEDGRWIQVGSTCLKDFIGAHDPDAAAKACEYLIELDDLFHEAENGGGCGGEQYINLLTFVATTAALIRCYGFVSRTKVWESGGVSTADMALSRLFDRSYKQLPEEELVDDDDRRVAENALGWAREELVAKEHKNDYEHNLAVAVGLGYASHQTAGLVASLITAYNRVLGEKAQKARWTDIAAKSEHFGEIKKRQTWELKVVRLTDFEGVYGTTWVVGMEDGEENQAVWFSSRHPSVVIEKAKSGSYIQDKTESLNVGETYRVKGTVKEHGKYNDCKQTILTRCVIDKVVNQSDQGRA